MTLDRRTLIAVLATVSYIVDGKIPTANRIERRLNPKPFPNVLDLVESLLPINGRDLAIYDHVDHDEVVFLDKECCGHALSYADHLRQELLLEQQCLVENVRVPGVVETDEEFYFFLQWDTSNADDCLDGVSIDFEAFCVSKIEYEQQFSLSSYNEFECVPAAVPDEDGAWWFDDIEGDNDDGFYSTPYFTEATNLIVYVVDTVVNLEHEHFDHIPAANKGYLGEIAVGDVDGDHGTHVTGLLVGQYYGVIRDPNVTVKACNAFPYGVGTTTSIMDCMEAISEDYLSARQNSTNGTTPRALINLSVTSSGCYSWFDQYFENATTTGGIIMTAAGNEDEDACSYSPSCSEYVITVGAYNSRHNRSSFSNYGDCVDTWGPGSKVLSSEYTDGSYGNSFGTTMATAIVGGVVGQFMNLNPNINDTSYEVIKKLLAEDEDGLYTFEIGDCQGTNCLAPSILCQALEYIIFPQITTTSTPSSGSSSGAVPVAAVPFGLVLFTIFTVHACI